jgi:cyanophycinase
MKLYLFGGAETDQGQAPILKQLINGVITDIKPKQFLHIPYARLEVPPEENDIWGEGWVSRDLNLDGIKLLDARSANDLSIAQNPTIFVNGGYQRDLLYQKIIHSKKLYDLVTNANFLIGESSGSTVCAEFRRTHKDGNVIIVPGLGMIKNTIIEAHYTQRNRHQTLRDEMNLSGAKYGIGIDSLTAIVIDTSEYPRDYQVIGNGQVECIGIK